MTATFNLTKSELTTLILQEANIIGESQTPTTAQTNAVSTRLNLLFKKWEAEGINAWVRRLGYLFPAYNTASYSLGSAGWHATNTYVSTTISADEAAAQTTLSLTSSAGMTASDFIGIELDDGTRQWTTISSVPDSTSVIINVALTSAASEDNTVITYTTKITRPLRIQYGTTLDLKNSNNETQLSIMSHDEYFQLPNKSQLGQPNQFYYDKLLGGTTPYTGTIYLYPTPQFVHQIIPFTYQESIADIVNSGDYTNFPQEWLYCILINGAVEMAQRYGKYTVSDKLQPKAQAELSKVQLNDSDDSPIRFYR